MSVTVLWTKLFENFTIGPDPIQPNPWKDTTHVHLWDRRKRIANSELAKGRTRGNKLQGIFVPTLLIRS